MQQKETDFSIFAFMRSNSTWTKENYKLPTEIADSSYK
jgi:hypothetical protein